MPGYPVPTPATTEQGNPIRPATKVKKVTEEDIRDQERKLQEIKDKRKHLPPPFGGDPRPETSSPSTLEAGCSSRTGGECHCKGGDCKAGSAAFRATGVVSVPSRAAVLTLRTGTTVLSKWFPRRGDSMIVLAEALANITAKLEVRVFSRPIDGTGNGTVVDSTRLVSLSAPGRQAVEWGPSTGTGLRELVRLEYRVIAINPPSTIASARFRILGLVWFDALRAAT